MIVKTIDGNSISVKPEEPDDMVALRRAISIGDRIAGSTHREIKKERESIRPEKGQRVRIRISLESKKIILDGSLNRLRIVGTITESDNESVTHGSHHSMQIKIGDAITITKNAGWTNTEKNLLKKHSLSGGFVLVAIDTSECGIGKIKGTRLEILPNIYSGASGKRYKNANVDMEKFYKDITNTVNSMTKNEDQIIVFGPGLTKNRSANHMQKAGLSCKLVDGIDAGSTGEDGIYIFTKSKVSENIIVSQLQERTHEIHHLVPLQTLSFFCWPDTLYSPLYLMLVQACYRRVSRALLWIL